jgi:hypothetical protein
VLPPVRLGDKVLGYPVEVDARGFRGVSGMDRLLFLDETVPYPLLFEVGLEVRGSSLPS